MKPRNCKGSTTIEAVLIVPMLLVMVFVMVGAMTWMTESGAFELAGNKKELGSDSVNTLYDKVQDIYGNHVQTNMKIQIPFYGEKQLFHRRKEFHQSFYESVYWATVLNQTINPKAKTNE